MNCAEPSVAAATTSMPLVPVPSLVSALPVLLPLLRRLGYSAARSSCAEEAWSAARTYWTSPDRIRIGATLICTAAPGFTRTRRGERREKGEEEKEKNG